MQGGGSFWDMFDVPSSSGRSGVSDVLSQGQATVEQVLVCEDIIQECKYGNELVQEFFSKKENVLRLIHYVVTIPPDANSSNSSSTANASTDSSTSAPSDASSSTASTAATTSSAPASEPGSADSASSSSSSTTATTSTSSTDSTTDASSAASSTESPKDDSTSTDTSSSSSSSSSSTSSSDAQSDDSDSDSSSTNTAADDSKDDAESEFEDTDADQSNTYPYLASEVLSALPSRALEAVLQEPDVFDLLFSLLDLPQPIDPSHFAYFRKVVVATMERHTTEFMQYVQTHDVIDKLLRHVTVYSIMDIIIMIAWDDAWGRPAVPDEWLRSLHLVQKLVDKLAPEHAEEFDVHRNVTRMLVDLVIKTSPTVQSPLVNELSSPSVLEQIFGYMFGGAAGAATCESSLNAGLSVLTVLVKRYAEGKALEEGEGEGEAEGANAAGAAESKTDGGDASSSSASSSSDPSSSTPSSSSSDSASLPQPFAALLPRLPHIYDLLARPLPDLPVQFGRAQPFGETRIKAIELTLMLLRAAVPAVDAELIRIGVFSKLLDCMFGFPWNNMMHGLVESTFNVVWNRSSAALKDAYVHDADLIGRIIHAYDENERSQAAKPRPCRMGYMGHLLRMSGTIEERRNSDPDELNRVLRDKGAVWLTFLNDKLEKELAKMSSSSVSWELEDNAAGLAADLGDDDDDDTIIHHDGRAHGSFEFDHTAAWAMPDDDDEFSAVTGGGGGGGASAGSSKAIDDFGAAAESTTDWFGSSSAGSSQSTPGASSAATFDDDFDSPATASVPITSVTTGGSTQPSSGASSSSTFGASDGFGTSDDWADFGADSSASATASSTTTESTASDSTSATPDDDDATIVLPDDRKSESSGSSSSSAAAPKTDAWANFTDADF